MSAGGFHEQTLELHTAQAILGSGIDGHDIAQTLAEIQAEAGFVVAHVHKVAVEQSLRELSPGIENCKTRTRKVSI